MWQRAVDGQGRPSESAALLRSCLFLLIFNIFG